MTQPSDSVALQAAPLQVPSTALGRWRLEASQDPESRGALGDSEPESDAIPNPTSDVTASDLAVTESEFVEPEVIDADDVSTRDEFERRVAERIGVARYHHGLKRVTHTPLELATMRDLERQAAVWVPVSTFGVTAVCAMGVVVLATKVAANPTHGRFSDAVVAAVTVGFLVAGFITLVRSQAHFDDLRPRGRMVRTDVADAYETVRDASSVFVDLGVSPQALSRVADLLPQAERLVDFLVFHELRGGIVKGHPAYEQVIRMGAEVTVLTDMAEEHLGRRSTRRRDRPFQAPRAEPALSITDLTEFKTLADVVQMIGIDVPTQRATRDRATDPDLLTTRTSPTRLAGLVDRPRRRTGAALGSSVGSAAGARFGGMWFRRAGGE